MSEFFLKCVDVKIAKEAEILSLPHTKKLDCLQIDFILK